MISSLLSKILPKNKDVTNGLTYHINNLLSPIFGDNYDAKLNDVYMSCANAHARYASKFSPEVYRGDEPSIDPKQKYLNRILSLRPNMTMNASSFWERVANLYYQENNVFIFLEWDNENHNEPLKALWILDPVENKIEMRVSDTGEPIISFLLNGTRNYTKFENVIHIARNVGPNVFGERNRAIKRVLDIIETNYVGIEQAVKSSAFIRFIVQSSTLLSPEARKQRAKDFAEAYLQNESSSGVLYLDSAQSIVPIDAKNKYANADEMKIFETKIYNYMGISEEILQGKANEDVFQAYYDSSLAPLAMKIEQELTYKLFSSTEISFGNKISITTDRLESASLKSKIAIAVVIQKLPTYRPNDINRLLGMPVTENGEKEFATLNYVDADKQNNYQGVDQNPTEPKEEEQNHGK